MIEQIYSTDMDSAIRLFLGRWFIQQQVDEVLKASELGETYSGFLVIKISDVERRVLRYTSGWLYGGNMETLATFRSDSPIIPHTAKQIAHKPATPANDLISELRLFDKSKLRHV